jgi:CRISPR-associated endonuclease Cas3-HD
MSENINKYLAHSKNEKGLEHGLSDHLTAVAKLMESFTENSDYQKVFKVAGLLHDLGKYQPAFQKYLVEGGRRGSVPHASWGAGLGKRYQQVEAAFAIDGHHKGLPDRGDLLTDLYEFEEPKHSVFNSIIEDFFRENQLNEVDFLYSDMGLRGTDKEFFIRMLI